MLTLNEYEKSINVQKVRYKNRYCKLDDFNILVSGGMNINEKPLNDNYQLKGLKLECSKFPSMLEARYDCKPAVINSVIVVVGGFDNTNKVLYYFEQFKQNEKSWVYNTEMPDKRTCFCICSFKRNLYMLGGHYHNFQTLNSCFVYNIKYEK